MSDNKDYSYEVERTLPKYGGEADKSITRTCGNCHFYNTERRLRLEEQRRNGTGECAGCPFRNVNKEMYALLLDIVTDYQCMPNPAVMADKIEAVLKKARGEE